MSNPCVCGHDQKDHDQELRADGSWQEGECGEVCCCAGYCTVLADSNLPWHAALAKAQARIAELEAALRTLNSVANEVYERDGSKPLTVRLCTAFIGASEAAIAVLGAKP